MYKVHEIRGYEVMLDFDLADMYGVPTKQLKEQVRRIVEKNFRPVKKGCAKVHSV